MKVQAGERLDALHVTHIVYARACGPDADSSHAQCKVEYSSEPTPENLEACRKMAVSAFREGFGRLPERIGVAVLPFLTAIDRADDE